MIIVQIYQDPDAYDKDVCLDLINLIEDFMRNVEVLVEMVLAVDYLPTCHATWTRHYLSTRHITYQILSCVKTFWTRETCQCRHCPALPKSRPHIAPCTLQKKRPLQCGGKSTRTSATWDVTLWFQQPSQNQPSVRRAGFNIGTKNDKVERVWENLTHSKTRSYDQGNEFVHRNLNCWKSGKVSTPTLAMFFCFHPHLPFAH